MTPQDDPTDDSIYTTGMDSPEFDAVLDELINEALTEAEVQGAHISSPAIRRLIATLVARIPEIEDDLRARFPNDDPNALAAEATVATTELAFDYGFRVGRAFYSRGHETLL